MTIKLRSILIFINLFASIFVACSFDANSAPINREACRSSTILNGMKIELSNSSPILVSRDTNRVEKSDTYYNQSYFEYPVINLKFTALDKDIQWQRDLYEYSFNLAYQTGQNKFENLGWFGNPSPPDYENLVKFVTLKKDETEQYYSFFLDLAFNQLYNKNDFEIIFKVSGELLDLNDAAPGSDKINSYKGDKNIWQEPFELCLKANWQYKD